MNCWSSKSSATGGDDWLPFQRIRIRSVAEREKQVSQLIAPCHSGERPLFHPAASCRQESGDPSVQEREPRECDRRGLASSVSGLHCLPRGCTPKGDFPGHGFLRTPVLPNEKPGAPRVLLPSSAAPFTARVKTCGGSGTRSDCPWTGGGHAMRGHKTFRSTACNLPASSRQTGTNPQGNAEQRRQHARSMPDSAVRERTMNLVINQHIIKAS